MRVAGIDPGISGAIALYLHRSTIQTTPDGLVDLPTMGESTQREINCAALRDILFAMQPDMVVIERVNAMPGLDPDTGERTVKMGATSIFRFGAGFGAIKATCQCLNLNYRLVMPGQWKKFYGLKGGPGSKEQARMLAIQQHPQIEPFLRRKKDHQRAEAFLLARYGAVTAERRTSGAGIDIEDIPA